MYKDYNMTQLTLPWKLQFLSPQMICSTCNDIVETIPRLNSMNSDIIVQHHITQK